MRPFAPLLALVCMTPACSVRESAARESAEPATAVRIAHLGQEGGDAKGLAALRAAFAARNPGYDVEWHPRVTTLDGVSATRVVFVQSGPGQASIAGGSAVAPELDSGDAILLREGESLEGDGFAAVVFRVPAPLPPELPPVIRPDWDERITDTPGGCAEETGAYRRILLTWLDTVGPYVFHALNCHRVRIEDSFTHYHPTVGGFDELYLVQMVQPGAVLYTGDRAARIENPGSVTREEAATLIAAHPLSVGDLVYLPRGVVHRGFGGVLAQVITTPGFRPGAEVGVDHHLRAINESLGLEGDAALPYHEAASLGAVVK